MDSKSPFRFKALLGYISQYISATYLAQGLGAVRGFVNAKYLGPENYGFWGWLMFLISFGYFLHGGVQEIMIKEVPAYQSKGRHDLASKSAQTAFTFLVLMLSIATLCLWGISFTFSESTPEMMRWGWRVAGIVLPLEVLFAFEQVVVRSDGKFGHLSRGLLIGNSISLALTFLLVIRFGLVGVFFVAMISPAVGLAYLRSKSLYAWRLNWDWVKIRSMLKAGWPILAMTLIFLAISWVDRVLVIHFVGMKGHGFYAVGAMLTFICFLFPEKIAAVIEPKLHYDYAHSEQASRVQNHLLLLLRGVSLVMPLVLAVVNLVIPIIVQHWLHEYEPGIPAMRILVLSSFFPGIIVCTKSFLVALGKQQKVLPVYAVAVVLNIALSYSLVTQGYGLVGIVLGSAAAYVFCGLVLLMYSLRLLSWAWPRVLMQTVSLCVPFAAMFLLSVTVGGGVFQQEHTSWQSPLGYASIALALTAYAGGVVWWGVRQIRLRRLAPPVELVPAV